jgi:hypothetical protein
MRSLTQWTLLIVLAFAAPAAAAGEPEKWDFVDKDDGIHVWKHEVPGHDVPDFRGQTIINASIDQILREMLDWRHHCDWMFACAESTMLKRIQDDRMIMYNRIDTPWPVWDRDVIAEIVLERSEDKKYLKVSFKNISSDLRSVPKKVVRLPKLIGFYKLWELEPGKTKILYQVEAELGGSVPRWMAVRGARDLPHVTLQKLRERVEDVIKKGAAAPAAKK